MLKLWTNIQGMLNRSAKNVSMSNMLNFWDSAIKWQTTWCKYIQQSWVTWSTHQNGSRNESNALPKIIPPLSLTILHICHWCLASHWTKRHDCLIMCYFYKKIFIHKLAVFSYKISSKFLLQNYKICTWLHICLPSLHDFIIQTFYICIFIMICNRAMLARLDVCRGGSCAAIIHLSRKTWRTGS